MKYATTLCWNTAAALSLGLTATLPAPANAQGAPAPAKPAPVPPAAAPAPGTRPADTKSAAKAAPTPQAKPGGRPGPAAGRNGAAPEKAAKKDASIPFFRDGVVPRLKIQISDAELQLLRQQNREYVRCTVIEEGGAQYDHVGVHLKGAAGSFRGVDDRPALTLNFDKFKDGQEFHDLDKIHLNNSVQDPGYLNELVSSELFLAAGVPAARTTHARVWLNGRDLGFYVLKEGFDKRFLKRHFPDASGNLYEGGFVQDIDGQSRLKSGNGAADRSDVKAVIAACREPDPAMRWSRLEQVVDIDRFLSFVAMEQLTCHWDGYCNNRNNYRFYFEPKSGKAHFFPHGMDQMFANPGASVLNTPGAMVASAVLNHPEGRTRYRARVTELAKRFVPADPLQKRVDEIHQRLRPVLAEMSPGKANEFDGQVKGFKDRLAARAKSLVQQLGIPEPPPVTLVAAGMPMPGIAKPGVAMPTVPKPVAPNPTAPKPAAIPALTRWDPRPEGDAKLELLEGPGGMAKGRTLTITAGPSGRCVASWRTSVTLPAGKYRFEARARTEGVKALVETSGTGAGVRISGSSRTNKLEGTSNWTPLAHEFQVQAAMQDVLLVAELRAAAGKVVFDAASLRIVRVGP